MIRTSTPATPGSGRRALRGRAAVGLAAATTAVLLLAGCAGSSTPEDRALDDLQQRTQSVTRSSADGDYAKALAQLEELRAAVEADLADASIDRARYDEVVARIDAVRTQLEASRDAAESTPTPSTSPSPSPSPSRTPTPSPTPSPTQSATPAPSPSSSTAPGDGGSGAPGDGPGDPGNGNPGNGNGSGNGNGNGNGNGGPSKPGNG